MSGINFVENRSNDESSGFRPMTAMVILLAGVYGILLCLNAVPGIVYDTAAVFITVTLFCSVMWFGYFYKRWIFFVLLLTVLAVQIYSAFFMTDTVHRQTLLLISRISGTEALPQAADPNAAVTEAMLFLSLFIAIWIFLLEIILKNHMIMYLLTSALLLVMPVFGVQTGMLSVILLVFFQLIFWTLQMSYRRKPANQLMEISTDIQTVARKSIRGMSVILAVLLALSIILVMNCAQFFYDIVYEMEGYVFRTVSQVAGIADDTVSGGKISNANNYHTGVEHLRLNISDKPEETVYLRGFSGGIYIGGDWTRASNEPLFKNMESRLKWGEWNDLIGSMYHSMYFALNSRMRGSDISRAHILNIKHSNGEYSHQFVPYYSQYSRRIGEQRAADYDEGYTYLFFEKKDVNIDWNNFSREYSAQVGWYHELQDAYMAEAEEAYTAVPEEMLPRLTGLVRDNPLGSREEITDFIITTLADTAEYTLTPGMAPLNEDIVEYFMFDNKRGYCVHFAAAATLMYRLYGIPARYASGYAVTPEQFRPSEEGSYEASVTDEAAHAWTEIFIDDYGWTPIEVTPPDRSGGSEEHAALDIGMLSGISSIFDSSEDDAFDDAFNEESGIENIMGINNNTSSQLRGSVLRTADSSQTDFLGGFIIPLMIFAVLLPPIAVIFRRKRRLKTMNRLNCREMYRQLIKLLHKHNCAVGFDGTEPEFAEAFSAEIDPVSAQRAERAREIAFKAAFGGRGTEESEDAYIRDLYDDTAAYIYENLKWSGRFSFRFIDVFA